MLRQIVSVLLVCAALGLSNQAGRSSSLDNCTDCFTLADNDDQGDRDYEKNCRQLTLEMEHKNLRMASDQCDLGGDSRLLHANGAQLFAYCNQEGPTAFVNEMNVATKFGACDTCAAFAYRILSAGQVFWQNSCDIVLADGSKVDGVDYGDVAAISKTEDQRQVTSQCLQYLANDQSSAMANMVYFFEQDLKVCLARLETSQLPSQRPAADAPRPGLPGCPPGFHLDNNACLKIIIPLIQPAPQAGSQPLPIPPTTPAQPAPSSQPQPHSSAPRAPECGFNTHFDARFERCVENAPASPLPNQGPAIPIPPPPPPLRPRLIPCPQGNGFEPECGARSNPRLPNNEPQKRGNEFPHPRLPLPKPETPR